MSILALQLPTLGLVFLAARMEPEGYDATAAAVTTLTFLSAIDLGGGVLVASRRSLPKDAEESALPAAALLTAVPPAFAFVVLCASPTIRGAVGLGDAGLLGAALICVLAALRSILLLVTIALGTLGEIERQLWTGGACAVVSVAAGCAALATGRSGFVAVIAGLAVGTGAALAVAAGSRGTRSLLRGSRFRDAMAVAIRSGHLALGRTAVQAASSGFLLLERSAAIARFSGTPLVEYDIATRLMTLPRYVASAAAPSMIDAAAAARQTRPARTVQRHLAVAFIAALPVIIGVGVALAPGGARIGVLRVAAVLAVGQLILVLTLPVTAQLNAHRRVAREASALTFGLVALGVGLALIRPSSPLALAITSSISQLAGHGLLLLPGRRPGRRE